MPFSLNLPGRSFKLEELPQLLNELDLIPLLIRRYIENDAALKFNPNEHEQVEFQKKFLAKAGIDSQQELYRWLQANGISEKKLSLSLHKALRIEQFKLDKFGHLVEPLFIQKKASLDRAMYSMLRVKDRLKSVELFTQINEEEATFAQLASVYSEGVEKSVNGLIGPLELGITNPAIAERLRISKPGQLWEPFEAEGWWLVLRLEKFLPASLDFATEKRLLEQLYEEWMKEKVAEVLLNMNDFVVNVPDHNEPDSTISEELPSGDTLAVDSDEQITNNLSKKGFFKSLFRG